MGLQLGRLPQILIAAEYKAFNPSPVQLTSNFRPFEVWHALCRLSLLPHHHFIVLNAVGNQEIATGDFTTTK